MRPDISIIVGTHNRLRYIPNLMEKIQHADIDPSKFELIIVDNSDDPAPVLEVVAGKQVAYKCRVIRSYPPGLSRARNKGLSQSEAEFVAFLDDDAEPSSAWISSILELFREYPGAAAVGGPILPLWPAMQPSWLNHYSEAALSIVERPEKLLFLGGGEYLYGTNMAFRRSEILAAGGFDENLGRMGSRSLLSSEEVAVQDVMRLSGRTILYSADAVVFHNVHAERVDQGWLRRRLAWQGVSDAIQPAELGDFDYLLGELAGSAAKLGIDHSVLNAFTETSDPSAFQAQLEFIRQFVFLALNSRPHLSEERAEQFVAEFDRGTTADLQNKASGDVAPNYVPLPAAKTLSLFFDFAPGHCYLYDTYAEAGPSFLFAPTVDPWDRSPEGLASTSYVVRELFGNATESRAAVCLLTLDALLHKPLGMILMDAAIKSTKRVVGILHRVPSQVAEIRMLSELSRFMTIAVLTEEIARDLKRRYSLESIVSLPHHPSIWKTPPSSFPLAAVPSKSRFGLIGEIREGKGIELLLSSLPYIGEQTKSKLHFILGGKCSLELSTEIREAFARHGVDSTLILRQAPPDRYAVLTDLEYADLIRSCDVGMLLYQGPQRRVMSGVLPSFVHAGAALIATSSSYVGELVLKHSLGITVSEEPEQLAEAIKSLSESERRTTFTGSDGFSHYREYTSPEATIAAVAKLLNN